MRKQLGLVLLVLGFLALAIGPAAALPIFVDYTYTGTPGDYLLDFSLTNNIPASYGQTIYFFGVDLADDPLQAGPAGWQDLGGTWDNSGYGGSDHLYPSTWITESVPGVASGDTLSGFRVHSSVIPDEIRFYAYGIGSPYVEEDAFYKGDNPGFEGYVGANELPPNDSAVIPEPASLLLLAAGLTGIGLKRRRA